jgi:hypothetical protein
MIVEKWQNTSLSFSFSIAESKKGFAGIAFSSRRFKRKHILFKIEEMILKPFLISTTLKLKR